MRILLIDDDSQVRGITALVLRRYGHEVVEAESGPAGLAEAAERAFDLLITDLNMPGMSGAEVVDRLVGEQLFDGPVIAISGDRSPPVELRASVGAAPAHATWLPKPFGVADLMAAVDGATNGGACPLAAAV